MSGGRAPKAKGSRFEIDTCHLLSKWVSHGMEDDLLWRSAISGGRATTRHAKSGKAQNVSGDICAVAPEGHDLTDYYHVECKHVRDLCIASFAFKGTGFLAVEWRRCRRQASQHNKLPMLIGKQNLFPTIVVTLYGGGTTPRDLVPFIFVPQAACALYLLSDVLQRPYTIPRLTMRR